MFRDPSEYDLSVRQQPKQARMCGVGGMSSHFLRNIISCSPTSITTADRRPIDPPPIVQLRVIDHNRRSNKSSSNNPNPNHPSVPQRSSESPSPQPHHLHPHPHAHPHSGGGHGPGDSENDNRDAGFFVFPDLSVRQEGSYRLKLSLFEVVG
ncbi:uncharacterized protein STEHIDRAFT_68625 [Stereum hirsutum FP-91666 SS1]|uniref:Velvet domain-containing protein n=1 Tax=Stereum hirsutum (strain FP-91666) TaxID=721885 RepID=R7RZ80_STEHR|nr:uncharacterized protein STEHIDRAFT_68625 [Stereum hirsutum FP-91666 SS1]EIM80230.1 hypothetical protein STEHIDRAFT_68625 [Stereum hirsutum FP-91666 SS1]